MLTEHRFDDLDLREEPSRGQSSVYAPASDRDTCWTLTITHTNTCSDACCL